MDVDCSSVTYDTTPSLIVLEALNKTLESLEEQNTTETDLIDPTKPENQSASPIFNLANSLLTFIDKDKASKDDIKEAFCRDIDTFSWEFVDPELHSCRSSSTCPQDQSCINNQCTDPCSAGVASCGSNAVCAVVSHQAQCSCPPGLTGDPIRACSRSTHSSLGKSISLKLFCHQMKR